jgi:DNA-nicking Smr family endonuclease
MANRRKSSPARSPDDEPFNNPFSGSLRGLRRKLRSRSSTTAPRQAPGDATADAGKRVPRGGDRAEFLDAVTGVTPLDSGGARVRRRSTGSGGRTTVDASAVDFTADENFDVRFSDRHVRASAPGVSRETLAKLEGGEFAVRSHVDLHGMALDDAKRAVDDFLADQQRRGQRCVLVITGKGRNSRQQVGVLREGIPQWLACGPSARRVLAFVTARQCDGGEGALYVLLRRHAARKARIDVVAGGGT